MQHAIAIEEVSDVVNVRPMVSPANINPFQNGLTMNLIRKSRPESSRQEVRKVLIIDRSGTNRTLIQDSLINSEDDHTSDEKTKQYDILYAGDHEAASKIIAISSPDLIVADWSTMINSVPTDSSVLSNVQYNLPILLLIDQNIHYPKIIWRNFTSGIVDCIQKPIDSAELRNRIQLLLSFTEKLKKMKEETVAIKDNLNLKHLELHLELLMHSGSVKDKFLEDIGQLSPFLTIEGRSKLKHLVKQLRWALNDENSTNFIRAFDKLNEPLYKQLENICMTITKNEKRLCAFTVKDQTGSEIAKVMGKTQNCVNVAFARLRAKLGLNSNKDLKAFLLNLEA